MAHPLPHGFTAIKDAKTDGATVNIIGVVVSAPERKKTRGTDWAMDFTIQDEFDSGSVGGYYGIGCRVFMPEKQLPNISPEDVVILLGFRLSSWASRLDCVGDYKTRFSMLVFPASKIPVPALSEAFRLGSQKLFHHAVRGARVPTAKEQAAVIHLRHISSSAQKQVQQHVAVTASKAASSNKLALIKDLKVDKFYDIRAQVVHMYHYADGVDIKVTDYTANKAMFYFADPETEESHLVLDKHFKGPFGYLTLNVTLYHNNAIWARENVAIGDYVFLRNVRTKISNRNVLEGTLFQNMVDRENPDKNDIRTLMNPSDIQEIDDRREEYEKARGTKSALQALKDVPAETSAKTASEKKKARRERQRAEKEAEQKELEEKARQREISRSGVNANIVAAHPEIKLSTISDIIYNPHLDMRTPDKFNSYTLPFVNYMFAHSMNDQAWNKHAKKQNSAHDSAKKERWEWGFVLLVEDASIPRGTVSEKLRLIVNNDAAQHLLDMSATNLKNKPDKLNQLKEKLFILWGNLMELKTELRDRQSDLPLPPGDNRLQNKPFDVIIEEYGCEVPRTEQHPFAYQQMYKLSQTKIQIDLD